ncbi:MAG: SH3 domain-containing protein [Patescibacteria group bacterium]
MKRKVLFLLGLVVVTALFLAIHLFVFGGLAQKNGHLIVFSSPDGTVFVNSKAEGRTPITIDLAPGEYNIKIIPNALDASKAQVAVPWEGKVKIYAKYETYVRRELKTSENESGGEIITLVKSQNSLENGKGELQVNAVPDGAIIALDGQDLGVTPDTFINVSSGVHDLSISSTKFKRRSVQIQVVPGYATVAEFVLGVDPDYEKKYPFGALVEASSSASLPKVPKTTREPTPTSVPEKVEILDTPTGFLRVRIDPSLNGKEISQVKPGETYSYISSENGWVKIKLTDGNEGWVSDDYVKEVK